MGYLLFSKVGLFFLVPNNAVYYRALRSYRHENKIYPLISSKHS
jgi:hypothetical protein